MVNTRVNWLRRKKSALVACALLFTAVINAWAQPQVNLGDLPPGKQVTIEYDVTVDYSLAGTEVSNQGTISGTNFTSLNTDDPDTATADDATVTSIDPGETALALATSSDPAVTGETVTFTATVTAPDDANLEPVSGDVEFRVNSTLEATVTLDGSGTATFDRAFTADSSDYTVRADFVANDAFKASDDSITDQTVVPANTATAITATNPSPSFPGDTVTVSFNVSVNAPGSANPAPTGTVTVTNGVVNCSAAVAAGACDVTLNDAGVHQLEATYNGDANFNTSTSSVFNHTVDNNAPTANDDSATVDEDSTGNTLDVLANDTDPDTGAGQSLSIASVGTPDNGGSVSIAGGGSELSYSPAADFFGTETFDYTVDDGAGGTDTATVTVTVDSVNDAPDAVDDNFTVAEDSAGNSLDVLANDSDIDPGDTLTVTAVGTPDNGGNVVNNGNNLDYSPAADFNGTETFSYTVGDGAGGTDTATVTVTVDNVNDTPDAVDNSFTVAEDSAGNSLDVLANDSDIDPGDTLTVTAVGTPDNGGNVVNNGNNLDYTPAADFNGTETFSYTVGDGAGGTDTATVTVTVNNINDAPTFTSTPVTDAVADAMYSYTVTTDDADSDAVTLAAPTLPGWLSFDAGTGELSGTPVAGDVGDHSVVLTADDSNVATPTEQAFTVTVSAADNVNPTANDDSFTVDEDSTGNTLDVLANDTEPNSGQTLTITGTGTPDNNGSVSIAGGGSELSYSPAADFAGTETFTYTIDDGEGGTDTATVTVTVNNTNDAPEFTGTPPTEVADGATYSYTATTDDVDGDAVTLAAPTLPGWLSFDPGTGELSGTPAAGDVGDHSVVLAADDGNVAEPTEQAFTVSVLSADSPDFAVSLQTTPDPSLTGEPLALEATVENTGLQSGSNATLEIALSGPAQIDDAGDCTANGSTLVCPLGEMAGGESQTVSVVLTVDQTADIYAVATVDHASDPNADNDTASLGFSVAEAVMNGIAAQLGDDDAAGQTILSGDVDGDGRDEVVIVGAAGAAIEVYRNEADTGWSRVGSVGSPDTAIRNGVLSDINNDGAPDLLIVKQAGSDSVLYVNDGAGGFTADATFGNGEDSYAAAVTDLNGDDLTDIVFANNGGNTVYLNTGAGFNQTATLGSADSRDVVLGDIDNDMLPDGVFANADDAGRVYTNTELQNGGAGTALAGETVDHGAALFDINGDNAPDLVFAAGIDEQDLSEEPANAVYLNDGNGGFTLSTTMGRVASRSLLPLDADADGWTDLLVVNNNGVHQLYRNNSGALALHEAVFDLPGTLDVTAGQWDEDILVDPGFANSDGPHPLMLNLTRTAGDSPVWFGAPGVDLSARIDGPKQLHKGEGRNYTITVSNESTQPASDVRVVVRLPDGVTGLTKNPAVTRCRPHRWTVSLCRVGALDGGESYTLTINLLAQRTHTGPRTISATVESEQDETEPDDNTAYHVIRIQPKRGGGSGAMHIGGLLLMALTAVIGLGRRGRRGKRHG